MNLSPSSDTASFSDAYRTAVFLSFTSFTFLLAVCSLQGPLNCPAKLGVSTHHPLLFRSALMTSRFGFPYYTYWNNDCPEIHQPVEKPIRVVQHVVNCSCGIVHLCHSYDWSAYWQWSIFGVLGSPWFVAVLLSRVMTVQQGMHRIALVACEQIRQFIRLYKAQCLQKFLWPPTQCWWSIFLLDYLVTSLHKSRTLQKHACMWMAKMTSTLTNYPGSE